MIQTVLIAVALVIAALAAFTFVIARRVTKAFPPEGKFIDIGADRVHYTDRGKGPAIVFVHGLCGNLRNFAYLDLERLAQSHRVIVIDRPGSGRSLRGAASTANIYAQARTVAQCIEKLGLDKPVLVGHSLGGAIALAVGLNHPQSIRRLALIAPLTHSEHAPPGAFKGLALTSPLARKLVSWTLAVPLSILNSRKAIAAVFAPEAMPKDFPFKGGGLLGLRPHVFYAASSDLVAAPEDLPDMERRYASMTVPVDVLYGRGDRILNVKRQGEALKQKLERVNLRVVDGGHMLPVTQPALTTDWILDVAAGAPIQAEAAASA
ncbi:alpha/beta fold hydrolase [Ralstonia mannitolilytica]|uniref:Aminoacrylate hydrolase RutD n=1 Tax=Ralstonia mannitolilytica TaxID=105219 RepID=A0AAD2AS37_9RALS|nr:alpha/beta fold hydrolase [Ralstonia mannitolilytica]MBY4717871.1 alpha/beta fold hydrolase [Ralstonia mannitolilytica]CAJ0683795.1 Putative aminoacrylate hydrolase RutD [Ralstonia mannitolilytica]CAJ0691430.1 Putative aminoacrylate hydrolase RutD [Ralstonia mannitolilytica]CAJ0873842.1 Putative aminoacrylate hydrolase RutD [Ralstonia mannitolilytica]